MKCFKCLGMGHYAYKCPTKKVVFLKDNGSTKVTLKIVVKTKNKVMEN